MADASLDLIELQNVLDQLATIGREIRVQSMVESEQPAAGQRTKEFRQHNQEETKTEHPPTASKV